MNMFLQLRSNFFFFLVALTVLSGFKTFGAPACHGGGGGQSIVVLSPEQKYQIGLATSYSLVQGQFDPYGFYSQNSEGTSSSSTTTTLGVGFNMGPSWQAALNIPIIYRQQTLLYKPHTHMWFGDPLLEIRSTLLDDVRFLPYRPGLNLYGGLRLPLGISTYNSKDPYGTDITGDGTTTMHVGVSASKNYNPLKLSVDGSILYPFAKKVTKIRNSPLAAPYTLKSGYRFQLSEGLSYLLNRHWGCGVGFNQLWTLKSAMNGKAILGSATRLFSTLLSISYAYDVSWGVGLSYATPFPFYKYLANQPHTHAVSLAMTYGSF